jgi:ABC-type Fe3+ transport system permease subunit
MDKLSLTWFIFGILVSIPLHWIFISMRKTRSKMQPEEKVATDTIIQTLSLLFIVAGFTFSIYGNYLTAKAGENNMTQVDFTNLVNQFNHWFQIYVAMIWALAGIAIGTGFILMLRSIWRYFNKHRQPIKKQDAVTIISTTELESLKERVAELKKTKADIDKFLDDIKDEKIKKQ